MATSPNTIKVTAEGGGAATNGIFLKIRVYDNAQVNTSPVIATQSGAAAHSVSVTPLSTGGQVVAATVNSSAAVTSVSPNTAQSLVDTVNTFGYGAFYSNSTASGTPITMGVSDTAAGGVAAVEIQPVGGTLTLDSSTPNNESATVAGSTVTTGAFAPPLGSLIVAMISSAGSINATGTTQAVTMTVTDSWGLTWTCAADAATENMAYAGVWYAQAPAAVAVTTIGNWVTTTGYNHAKQLYATGGWASRGLMPLTIGSLPGYAVDYSWSVASGSLPPGLTLTTAGLITGTPTTPGTYTLTVKATDPFGNSGTSNSFTITVNQSPAPAATPWVVQHWDGDFGGSLYSYGGLGIPVNTSDHNWIFVACSWINTGGNQAVALVADSAHNVYQDLTFNNGGITTQIFACPNAAAATEVFVSTSSYVWGFKAVVVEVGGLGAGYIVDASNAVTGGPSTSASVSLTLTGADFVFAAGAFGSGNVTITQNGSVGPTWNSIWAGTNSALSQAASWAYASAGAVTMTYSVASSTTYSMGMVAVKAGQAPPVNSNPNFPVIKVLAAFGYNQSNPTSPHSWTDISSRYLSLSGNRGRDFELSELSAADLTLTLDNADAALSPGNSNSPYWPNVTVMTPIRVMSIWQGRYRCVFSGNMIAIPQNYDFQRGMVKVSVSDDYVKLPQTLLGSCMIEEALWDGPLDLWPMNEQQGTPAASNWSGRSTAFLVPVNGNKGAGLASMPSTNNTWIHGFPYPGSSGFGQQNGNGTGLFPTWPSGLQGTQDTVWGNIGGTPGGHYYAGTILSNKDDQTLPWTSTGATYEVWACIANVTASRTSGAVVMMLSDKHGGNGGGIHFRLRVVGGNSPAIQVEQVRLTGGGTHTLRTKNLYDSKWHHYSLSVTTSGTVTVRVDGVNIGSFTSFTVKTKPTLLQFGGDATVNAAVGAQYQPGFFTGFMAMGVVYDKVLDVQRSLAHYYSGRTGFDGESTGTRIRHILTYANWNAPQALESGVSRMQMLNYLNTGGYGSMGLSGSIGQFNTAGGAAIDSGSQADMVVSDIALSENGFLWVMSDGTIAFRSRKTQYGLPITGALGDMDYALNGTSNFTTTLGEWTGISGGSVGFSTAWGFADPGCALVTVSGSPTQTFLRGNHLPVNALQGTSMWVMSPQGTWVQTAIDWYNSSGYMQTSSLPGPVWCPPNTPVHLKLPPVSPAVGATSFVFGPTIFGSAAGGAPVNGTQLYMDRPRASVSGFAVPYDGDSLEINYDIQYLYNDVVVTRNLDQATYRGFNATARKAYLPRAYTRIIYTSLQDKQAIPDCANWLLADYDTPRMRIEQLAIEPTSNPDAWEFVLGIDVGDMVSFQRTPAGSYVPKGNFIVLGIEIDWEPDNVKFTYNLAPNPTSSLVLDDPVRGIMQSGTPNRLGW